MHAAPHFGVTLSAKKMGTWAKRWMGFAGLAVRGEVGWSCAISAVQPPVCRLVLHAACCSQSRTIIACHPQCSPNFSLQSNCHWLTPPSHPFVQGAFGSNVLSVAVCETLAVDMRHLHVWRFSALQDVTNVHGHGRMQGATCLAGTRDISTSAFDCVSSWWVLKDHPFSKSLLLL